MEHEARRVSDQLRHKHIRTLEVLRRLADENQILRKKLNLGASDYFDEDEATPEGTEPLEELVERQKKDLQTATEAAAESNLETKRVMAELAEAQAEANTARAAEEANGLTLMALQTRNKALENAIMHAEGSSKKQAERLGAQVIELQEELEAAVAEAREAQARAKLDASRLESEVEELRRGDGNSSLRRAESAWIDGADSDETSLSQREVEDLRLSLCKATRRASTAKRQCCEFERLARSEALRREIAEGQLHAIQATKPPTPAVQNMPLPSAPQHGGGEVGRGGGRRLAGGAEKSCAGKRTDHRQGAATPMIQVIMPSTDALEIAAEQQQQPPFPPQPSSSGNDSEDGSPSPRSRGSATKAAEDELVGSSVGMRRLRESEKRLRESNTKLQRKLSHNAKRLVRAESFASDLEAELKRVAGSGATFETFVVLRRENQALRMQLAEIKQAHAMVLATAPPRKVSITFSDPLRRHGRGSYGRSAAVASRGIGNQGVPLVSLPRPRAPSTAATGGRGGASPLSQAYFYKQDSNSVAGVVP